MRNNKNFLDFSDQELKQKILEYADHPIESNLLSVSRYTKGMLGLVELQGRQNNRLAKLSLIVTILALFVSFVGIFNFDE